MQSWVELYLHVISAIKCLCESGWVCEIVSEADCTVLKLNVIEPHIQVCYQGSISFNLLVLYWLYVTGHYILMLMVNINEPK